MFLIEEISDANDDLPLLTSAATSTCIPGTRRENHDEFMNFLVEQFAVVENSIHANHERVIYAIVDQVKRGGMAAVGEDTSRKTTGEEPGSAKWQGRPGREGAQRTLRSSLKPTGNVSPPRQRAPQEMCTIHSQEEHEDSMFSNVVPSAPSDPYNPKRISFFEAPVNAAVTGIPPGSFDDVEDIEEDERDSTTLRTSMTSITDRDTEDDEEDDDEDEKSEGSPPPERYPHVFLAASPPGMPAHHDDLSQPKRGTKVASRPSVGFGPAEPTKDKPHDRTRSLGWGSASTTSLAHTKYELLESWTQSGSSQKAAMIGKKKKKVARGSIVALIPSVSLVVGGTGSLSVDDDEEKDAPFRNRVCDVVLRSLIIHPCSPRRAVWDTLSLLLVTWDMVMLPLQFLEPESTDFTRTLAWITRMFWTFDLPASFLTGFLLSDGSIQLNPKSVIRHYVKTWFTLDAMLVALDWAEVGSTGDSHGVGRMGKTGRLFRIIRMLRLLRLARMREVLKLFTFRIQSERITIIADVSKMLLSVLASAHLMACCWFGVSNIGDLTTGSWILETGARHLPLEYRYFLSLHWSLSQFSGGMDEFKPHNFHERAYAVMIFLIAFMMSAICVSGLTSSMTRLLILASHHTRQLSILRRYLIQNGISDKLAMRVQRNALHALSEQQRLMGEKNVELLQAISGPLRVELHFEMYSPVLECHPFFIQYVAECPHIIQKICHQAMDTLLISTGDVVFNPGEIPDKPNMYVVCNGLLEYTCAGGVFPLYAENWLSEGALWTHWMHRGKLKAVTDGRVCALDSNRFSDIVRTFEHADFNPRFYAVQFVNALNKREDEHVEIDDMEMGTEDELSSTMHEVAGSHSEHSHSEARHTIVSGALNYLHQVAGSQRRSMFDNDTQKEKRKSVFMGGKSVLGNNQTHVELLKRMGVLPSPEKTGQETLRSSKTQVVSVTSRSTIESR